MCELSWVTFCSDKLPYRNKKNELRWAFLAHIKGHSTINEINKRLKEQGFRSANREELIDFLKANKDHLLVLDFSAIVETGEVKRQGAHNLIFCIRKDDNGEAFISDFTTIRETILDYLADFVLAIRIDKEPVHRLKRLAAVAI